MIEGTRFPSQKGGARIALLACVALLCLVAGLCASTGTVLAASDNPGGAPVSPAGGVAAAALPSCVNPGFVNSVAVVGGTLQVNMQDASLAPHTLWTPILRVTLKDGSGNYFDAFCTDALEPLVESATYCYTGDLSDPRLIYLIAKYPPNGNNNIQQAARQAAVWHYTNGLNLMTPETTDPDANVNAQVRAQYDAILADVDAIDWNNPPAIYSSGALSMTITPATATRILPGGAASPFTVTLLKGSKPLAGYTVNVSTSFGALDKVSGQTDANGQVQFVVTSAAAGTANIAATTVVTVPSVLQYLSQDNPETDQPMGVPQLRPTTVDATAQVNWSLATPGKITLTKSATGTTANWSFTFLLDNANARTVTKVAPVAVWDNLTANQTYTLTEVAPGGGWITGAPVCTVNGSSISDGDPAAAGFQILVTPGAAVQCAVTNQLPPGRITLTKTAIGTTANWAFTFLLNSVQRIATNASPTVVWSNLEANRTYTLTEVAAGNGWQAQPIDCTVNNAPVSDADPTLPGLQIAVAPGANIACSALNSLPEGSITLTKVAVGTTADWSFTFSLDGVERTATKAVPDVVWSKLEANRTYTLTEVTPGGGWQTSVPLCTLNGQAVVDADPNTAGLQIEVTAGAAILCSATNTLPPGKITLTKTVTGTTAPWSFTFTLDNGAPKTATNATPTVVWANLEANRTYTLTEVAPGGGWVTGAPVCTVGGSAVGDADPQAPGFQIAVTPGANVLCAVQNTLPPGRITLTKLVNGAVANWSFSFTLDGADQRTATAAAPTVSWTNLEANRTYTLAEVDPGPNWLAGAPQCAVNNEAVADADPQTPGFQITVTAGANVTCSVTNSEIGQPGKITLTKLANVTAGNWSFTFTLDGANALTATKASPVIAWDNLTPNQTYTLAEVAPGGGWQTGAPQCTLNGQTLVDGDPNAAGFQIFVSSGANVLCSVTNTLPPGSIRLTKAVSGPAADWSFTFTLNGTDARTAIKASPVITWTNLEANQTYTLSEVNPGAGWQAGQPVCTVGGAPVVDADPNTPGFQIRVTPGANVICTVTNTVTPGQITLTKRATGTTADWSFTFTLDGGNAKTATKANPVVVWSNLAVNQTYTLVEVAPGGGWQTAAPVCTVNGSSAADADPNTPGFQIAVTPGADVRCSVTNTLPPGQISVTKAVANATGSWSFAFTLDGAQQRVVTDSNPVAIWANLEANRTYTLAEVDPGTGWQAGAPSCTVNGDPVADVDPNTAGFQIPVAPGANVACAVTNTAQVGTITATKVVTQTNQPTWSFIFRLDGANAQSVSKASPTVTWNNLIPGQTYVLSEDNRSTDWVEGIWECAVNGVPVGELLPSRAISIPVTPGENVVCSKFNTDVSGTNLDPGPEPDTFATHLYLPNVTKR